MGVDCPVGSLLPWRSAMTGRSVRILALVDLLPAAVHDAGRNAGRSRPKGSGPAAAGDASRTTPANRRQCIGQALRHPVARDAIADFARYHTVDSRPGPSSKRRSWWRPCRSTPRCPILLFALTAEPRARQGILKRRWRMPRAADNARAAAYGLSGPLHFIPYRVPHIAHQAQRGGVPPNAGSALRTVVNWGGRSCGQSVVA